VSHVYADRLRVRHNELDTFGRVYPAAYLRWLTDTAIAASTAAGFDAAWYRRFGAWWLVRRSILEIRRPLGADAEVGVRTWVDDFRRVRSWRRYEIVDEAGEVVVSAASDWVFTDTVTGKPRRVPPEMEQAFGFEPGHNGTARPAWSAPPAPPAPARTPHRVGYAELDSLQHVNNAAYVDILSQGALDALASVGWPLTRLATNGAVPRLASVDVEYLEAALYGDELDVVSWFTLADGGFDAHQQVVRAADGTRMVRGSSAWRWADARTGMAAAAPAGLAEALGSVRAA
jgi:YbgC/YbaW family acyl-CoA thioester hydrolase